MVMIVGMVIVSVMVTIWLYELRESKVSRMPEVFA